MLVAQRAAGPDPVSRKKAEQQGQPVRLRPALVPPASFGSGSVRNRGKAAPMPCIETWRPSRWTVLLLAAVFWLYGCPSEEGSSDAADDDDTVECPSDTTSCSGDCVDLDADPDNCGQCGNICPLTKDCCDGRCVALTFNPDNCGSCGHSCSTYQDCVDGACLEGSCACQCECDCNDCDIDVGCESASSCEAGGCQSGSCFRLCIEACNEPALGCGGMLSFSGECWDEY